MKYMKNQGQYKVRVTPWSLLVYFRKQPCSRILCLGMTGESPWFSPAWALDRIVPFGSVKNCTGSHRGNSPFSRMNCMAWSCRNFRPRCTSALRFHGQTDICSHRDNNPYRKNSCTKSSWPYFFGKFSFCPFCCK